MIGSVSSQNQMYAMQQAYQAQASAETDVEPFEDTLDSAGASSSSSSSSGSAGSSSSASGPGASLLSSNTLASLLGLQMVNGQAQGGASGAQLNLPQTTMSPAMDPNSLLNSQTLQMLQSIGA